MFKRGLKIIGRSFLTLFYVGIVVGLFVAGILLWNYISNPSAVFDFFGTTMNIWLIALLAVIVIGLPGLYGLVICVKMIVALFKKNDYKLHWVPKAIPIGLAIFAIFTVNFYVPTWSMYLGITPNYGPYIAYHGEDSMLISWDTSKPTTSIIYWGSSADNVSMEAIGGEWYWAPHATNMTNHHAVKLTGLQPNGTYYYRVPSLDNIIHSFKVPPASPGVGEIPETVIFTVMGDTQGAYTIQRKNIALMMVDPEQPMFTINTGDLVNASDNYAEWAMLFNSRSYGRIMATIPLMAASGNHDTWGDEDFRKTYTTYLQYNYASGRNRLEETPGYGVYYSYNYSSVHMVALDNFENDTYTSSVKETWGTYFTTTQLQWLEADLARNTNNWKFVYMHVPMYSNGDFGSNKNLCRQLEPIFEKYGVDAVFYGHDHIFESFYNYKNNATSGGIYHFIVGGSANNFDDMYNVDSYGKRIWTSNVLDLSQTWRYNETYGTEYALYGELTHHYGKVKVVDQTATFTFYRTDDGSVIKSYTINRTY